MFWNFTYFFIYDPKISQNAPKEILTH